jgi:HK97 gp10 family phage protein
MKAGAKFEGYDEFRKLMDQFPDKVQERAAKRGLTRAAARLRRNIRRSAPRVTGTLRKSIGSSKLKKSRRGGSASIWVQLTTRFYYKRLEFDYNAQYAFFEKAYENAKGEISKLMVSETRLALYNEAGKAFAKMKRAIR